MAQELLTALTGAYDRPIDNPYGIGASALAQSMPMLVNPYGSVGSNFAAVAGAGLLSGLLGYFARQDAQETNARIAGLQSQYLNPTATEAQRAAIIAQEPRLSALQNALMAQKLNLQQIKAEEEQKALGKAAGEIAVIEAKTPIEQQATKAKAINDALNAGQTTYANPITGNVEQVPGSTGVNQNTEKALKEIQDTFNKNEDVKKFSIVESSANALSKALADTGAVSDLELVRRAVQMIEPGMAVREGEQSAVMNSQSIPDAWRGQLTKALEGGTGLDANVREGIKSLAVRAYEAQRAQYDKAYSFAKNEVLAKNLPTEYASRISYLGTPKTGEEIFNPKIAAPTPTATPTATPTVTPPAGLEIPAGYIYLGVNPLTGKPRIQKVG
jgi:hypothetical protein